MKVSARSVASSVEHEPTEEVPTVEDALAAVPGVVTPGDKMLLAFTCGVCETRVTRKISKQAYETGLVVVRCHGCENQHLIADRLGWFGDESFNFDEHVMSSADGTLELVPTQDGQ